MFLNTFLSYVLLVLVFVAASVAAVFLGIALRKRKDAATEQETKEDSGI